MKKHLTILIPASDELQDWLGRLSELSLLAETELVPVSWQEPQTGAQDDWSNILSLVLQKWEQTDGFVIWCPEQSLLNLASYLALSFEHPGKPVVLFSAPNPGITNQFTELGLKSVLINACYAALSEMAEVTVLSGNRLFRPQDCYWKQEGTGIGVASRQKPLAVFEFGLNFTGPYLQRSRLRPLSKNPVQLEPNIHFQQKIAGQPFSAPKVLENTRAVFMQSMAALWSEKEIEAARSSGSLSSVPIIWYSETPWQDFEALPNELFISHPQSWWAAFVTQVAFGQSSVEDQALDFIRKRL